MSNRAVYAFGAMVWLAAMGCQSAGEERPGRTLQQREALSEKADAFLDEVDGAWLGGDFDAVYAGLDSAARYAPELADIPFWRGRAAVMLSRLDEAKQAFEDAIALDPFYPGAWYELGNIAFRERDYRKALEHYEREEAVLVRLLEDEIPYPSAEPAALAATRLQMGRVHDQLGQVDEAYDAFRAALAADSTYSDAHYELSQLYETDGELAKALDQARKAHASAPESPDNQYALGALLLRNDMPEEAVPYLRASVEKRPWYHPALNNLGRALVQTGRQEEGETYLKRGERMQELDVEIGQARLDVQQAPDAPQRWIELARLLVEAGRYEEAEDAFNKAIYLEPMNLAFHNDMGNLRLLRGDAEGAVRRFRMILEFDSTFADAWMNLGVAYALSERYDDAQSAWERVLELAPDHVEAKENLQRLSAMK